MPKTWAMIVLMRLDFLSVVGMLTGATAGIGMVHALYCDIRFAADNAVFTTSFARRGLIAEHGLSWLLSMVVGHANALDLRLSARKVLAPEAQAMGLVNKVFAPDQLASATYAYVRDLVHNVSPRSMAVIKRQQYDAPFQSLAWPRTPAKPTPKWHAPLPATIFAKAWRTFWKNAPPNSPASDDLARSGLKDLARWLVATGQGIVEPAWRGVALQCGVQHRR